MPVLPVTPFCQLLRLIALRLNPLGSSAMFYLAAAVSDFYVPWDTMVSPAPKVHVQVTLKLR